MLINYLIIMPVIQVEIMVSKGKEAVNQFKVDPLSLRKPNSWPYDLEIMQI